MATEMMPLKRVLGRQDGVVTRAQLQRCGVTDGQVRAQVVARRWRVLNDAVICTHNGPLRDLQGRWAAVLSAQPPVALCGLSAMADWGVAGISTPAIHVIVVRGARVLRVPDLAMVVHESRRFGPKDVCNGRLPPSTTLARAVIDAAVWTPDLRNALRIVTAPIQQRLTSADRLRETLESAGHVTHRRVLLALLADLGGGAEALSEVEFLRWCRRHGFPRAQLQVRLDARGRRRYLDAVFTRSDGGRVLVEIDGGVHLTLATRWLDTAKDNDAALSGELTLRFPSVALHCDDAAAIRQLREALAFVSAPRAAGDGWR